jgi:hypothetical protein
MTSKHSPTRVALAVARLFAQESADLLDLIIEFREASLAQLGVIV